MVLTNMKKPKLIQAALITISIAILLGLFVKMQTIQPQDIDYDSDPYSKIQYIDDIRKVINTLKGGSEKKKEEYIAGFSTNKGYTTFIIFLPVKFQK